MSAHRCPECGLLSLVTPGAPRCGHCKARSSPSKFTPADAVRYGRFGGFVARRRVEPTGFREHEDEERPRL